MRPLPDCLERTIHTIVDLLESEPYSAYLKSFCTMGVTFSQFFPLSPTLTEANIGDQKGKVFLVTGGALGVGFEVCGILYQAGGKIYLAGRSEEKAEAAI